MGLDGASIPNGQPALQERADATGKWGRERERVQRALQRRRLAAGIVINSR